MNTISRQTDSQLIDLFKDNDLKAFDILISRHQAKVYGSILYIVKDQQLAEDIYQDAIIKAIESIRAGRYNDEGNFRSWMCRIGHNMCIDYFRKVKRTPVVKPKYDQDVFDILNFSEAGIDAKIMSKESQSAVCKMLDYLPEEQKEIILLRHFAELSYKETAAITHCSINTSLGRMRYALANLRKIIKAKSIAL